MEPALKASDWTIAAKIVTLCQGGDLRGRYQLAAVHAQEGVLLLCEVGEQAPARVCRIVLTDDLDDHA